ncbi:MAG TPA: mechanosensitive ion channel domain-containing protein [Pusillimonas sp.]|uniref:mechanosensitive ion channel domain-containing protein n=1 Tax=Pusillimonas sp. TaxID=3040095 RepID=UPI002C496FA8|nr:mechanosensitive ion channel domain-containing protein [Pusillimonas sp.]HUH88031.1 mechanosensitive ion channel domain-containing protein [Pusillimonas sp.]
MFSAFVVLAAAQAQTPGSSPLSGDASASQDASGKEAVSEAPSYAALADLLENERSRKALIAQLRDLAGEQGDAAAATAEQAANARLREMADPLGGLAGALQAFAVGLAQDFSQTAETLQGLFAGKGIPGMTAEQWRSRLLNLVLVIAATLAAFVFFRLVAGWFFRRLDAWVQRSQGAPTAAARSYPFNRSLRLTPRVGAIVGALAIDAGAVLLASVAGYGLALFIQEQWRTSILLALVFVSAFVAVELARSLCRAVFSERHPHLRLWRMDNEPARYWSAWLQRVLSITGYGMLVAVPVASQMLTPSVGQLMGLFIMLGVYVYALRVIWTKRSDVRHRLEQRAVSASNAFFSTLYRIAGRSWHWVGLAYFTALLVATQVDQQQALPFMAQATLRTLIVVGIATLLAAALSSLTTRRITLSTELRSRLPLLERRLNSYWPGAIRLMRGIILVVSLLLVLDAWRAFDLSTWLYSPEGRNTISTLVHVAVILLLAMGIWTVVASIIESRLNDNPTSGRTTERQKTLLSLFRSAALAVIVTMTVLVVLSQIGVDIGPLIAGAGVVGLAIGFGAQKLVQDVITGVFIQLENGMNHNDVVEVAGIFGTVEKITIRSVGIRTLDGGYHLIPFSAIDKVSNHMRDFGYHYGEYTIAYGADVDEAIRHLHEAFEEFMQDPELAGMVMDKIEIPGVTALHERGYNIRVLIKTVPGLQWAVQRGFNRLVRKRFAEAGIDLPYPQTVLHFANPQAGDTQVAGS